MLYLDDDTKFKKSGTYAWKLYSDNSKHVCYFESNERCLIGIALKPLMGREDIHLVGDAMPMVTLEDIDQEINRLNRGVIDKMSEKHLLDIDALVKRIGDLELYKYELYYDTSTGAFSEELQ
jgi:hypothetical protein